MFFRINFTGKMKNHQDILEIARILQNDKSKDVRFFLEGLKLDGSVEENNCKSQGSSPLRKKIETTKEIKAIIVEETKQEVKKDAEDKTEKKDAEDKKEENTQKVEENEQVKKSEEDKKNENLTRVEENKEINGKEEESKNAEVKIVEENRDGVINNEEKPIGNSEQGEHREDAGNNEENKLKVDEENLEKSTTEEKNGDSLAQPENQVEGI